MSAVPPIGARPLKGGDKHGDLSWFVYSYDFNFGFQVSGPDGPLHASPPEYSTAPKAERAARAWCRDYVPPPAIVITEQADVEAGDLGSLGPAPPEEMAPGERLAVTLDALGVWRAPPEVLQRPPIDPFSEPVVAGWRIVVKATGTGTYKTQLHSAATGQVRDQHFGSKIEPKDALHAAARWAVLHPCDGETASEERSVTDWEASCGPLLTVAELKHMRELADETAAGDDDALAFEGDELAGPERLPPRLVGMAKKKPKGHEAEAFGYRIATEAVGNGWFVTVSHKPKADAKARIVAERDGFDYEGQALDWGDDWTLENRPYTVDVAPADKGGFVGKVLNEHGFDEWRSSVCSDGDEAQAMCDAFVHARRQHDQLVLAERKKLRANARMLEADYRATEVDALAQIEEGKASLKAVAQDREQLRRDLESPQIEFNFIAELEKQKVANLRGLGAKQVDLEDRIGDAPQMRGNLRRLRAEETPTP